MAKKRAAALTVTSGLFAEGGTIPGSAVHAQCQGGDVSPDLRWSEPPEGTASFAVICHDPDAPTGVGFFHWVLFNLPGESRGLPAGAGAAGGAALPRGAVQGSTDYGESRYGGPCPPPGKPHRYQFTVYAVDVPRLESGERTTGAKLRFLLREHTLASGTLTGLYGR